MRKRNLYIAAWLLLGAAFEMQAQDSDPLKREMTIEKDFTPIVRDASKVNVLPEVESPRVSKTTIQYSDWSVPVTLVPQLQSLPAAEFGTAYPFAVKRGYADISLGNYWNASASAGYRFFDTPKDRLDFWFQHLSIHGDVNYLENYIVESLEMDKKTRQKRSDNLFSLSYRHQFDRLSWNIQGDYRYNLFNYYGLSPVAGIDLLLKDELPGYKRNQAVQQWGVRTSIESQDKNNELKYTVSAGFERYASRLGYMYGLPGSDENHLSVGFKLLAPVRENSAIGIDGGADVLFYAGASFPKSYHALLPDMGNYGNVRLNPYYRIGNERIRLKLGVNADFSAKDGTVVRFAPDVHFSWMFADRFFLYSDLTGGKTLNTLAALSQKNIYVNPSQKPGSTYTPADWSLGLRSNRFQSFTFDLYGGMKTVSSALFDYQESMWFGINGDAGNEALSDLSRSVISYRSQNAVNWNVGAKLEYRYLDFLEASLDWKHNYWRTRGGEKMQIKSGLPVDELNFSLRVNATKHLSFLADYFMATGRRYHLQTSMMLSLTDPEGNVLAPERFEESSRGTLRDIHNVNVGATYRFNDFVHVRVQFNNILNRHYNLYYGMPAQRFHFMAGVGVNF